GLHGEQPVMRKHILEIAIPSMIFACSCTQPLVRFGLDAGDDGEGTAGGGAAGGSSSSGTGGGLESSSTGGGGSAGGSAGGGGGLCVAEICRDAGTGDSCDPVGACACGPSAACSGGQVCDAGSCACPPGQK